MSTVGKPLRLFAPFYFIFLTVCACVCVCVWVCACVFVRFITQHLKRPVWRIWCWQGIQHCRKKTNKVFFILNLIFLKKKKNPPRFQSGNVLLRLFRGSFTLDLPKEKLLTDFQPTRSKMLFWLQMNVNVLQMMGEVSFFFLSFSLSLSFSLFVFCFFFLPATTIPKCCLCECNLKVRKEGRFSFFFFSPASGMMKGCALEWQFNPRCVQSRRSRPVFFFLFFFFSFWFVQVSESLKLLSFYFQWGFHWVINNHLLNRLSCRFIPQKDLFKKK